MVSRGPGGSGVFGVASFRPRMDTGGMGVEVRVCGGCDTLFLCDGNLISEGELFMFCYYCFGSSIVEPKCYVLEIRAIREYE